MMTKNIKLFVSSPFGFSEAGREFMYNTIFPIIYNAGYDVLDPWEKTSEKSSLFDIIESMPLGMERIDELKKLNNYLGFTNSKMIEESSGLFAILDGVDVDSGTASEIGYASAFGKKVLGYRSDFRHSRDNDGCIVNLQVEYFIRKNGGDIITSVKDMPYALKNLFG